jgi:hypothetical protein
MIYTTDPRPEPDKIVIALHNTSVSRATQPLQYSAVNDFHRTKNWGTTSNPWYQSKPSQLGKWGGYNIFCEPTGERKWFRKYGEETIAQRGYNCTSLSNCFVLSYCMAGNFAVEKPTQHQINDLKNLVQELKKAYPSTNITVQQHKDFDPNRTCAELLQSEIDAMIIEESPEDIIARQAKEIDQLRGMITQLIAFITKIVIN